MIDATITLDDIVSAVNATIKQEIDPLKADVAVLKSDVAELKTDMRAVKHDVATMKDRLFILEKVQVEIRDLLAATDGRIWAMHSDLKEIYDRLIKLEKRAQKATTYNDIKRISDSLQRMQRWAERVGAKTGVHLPKL